MPCPEGSGQRTGSTIPRRGKKGMLSAFAFKQGLQSRADRPCPQRCPSLPQALERANRSVLCVLCADGSSVGALRGLIRQERVRTWRTVLNFFEGPCPTACHVPWAHDQ